jgi:signal transduction histidine kinase/ligand-binding sensor domain-containing protein/DNA-binding response OmpR family regulator
MFVNYKRFIFSVITFIFLIARPVLSQNNSQNYNFVSKTDIITRVAVYTITQDDFGFIWMGTNGTGLIRYDGIDYNSYRNELNDSTSISSSLIYCTKIDSKKRLWIGTEEGLNLYDRKLDRFKKISLGNAKFTNASIRCIETDNIGNLYVGTLTQGLFKLNLETFGVEKISNSTLSSDSRIININCIRWEKSGRIFVGTNFGLKEVDIESNSLVNSILLPIKEGSLVNSSVYTLIFDNLNDLWVGTLSNGVFKVKLDIGRKNEHNTYEHFPISDKKILSMIQLEDGSLMFGTENDGLFHLNTSGAVIKNYLYDKTDNYSIRSNSIWSLFVDDNQRIWMGYYNNGVAVSDKLYNKFNSIESLTGNMNSLTVGSVTGIIKDEIGDLWIAMDGGGIDKINSKSGNYTHINKSNFKEYSGLTSDYLETIFIDSKQNIWTGSWDGGVYLLKKGSKNFINFNTQNTNGNLASNTILSFAEDSNGIIWIGSFFRGLHSYNPSTNEITHHNSKPFVQNGITTSDVRDLLVDSENTIWLGTTKGLFKIRKHTDEEYSIISMGEKMAKKFNNEASANYVLSLLLDVKGNLWVGTRGAGLCKYNTKTDEIFWYNKLTGLNEENIVGIVQSLDGNLWVSGNSGLTKLDENKNEISTYSINDGLLSNDYNFNATLIDKDGILYFGNFIGIDYFNPKEIKINKSVPSLYLIGFKLFNKDVVPKKKGSPLNKVIAETKSIVLDHTQSVFTIEYAGLNFTRTEKNQYAYYLEGLEDTWNYVGNIRSATYTSLNHGEYNFKLKAANNDGIWNEEPLMLKITILPPWWKTKWAIFAYISFLLISLYILNRMAQIRIREKQIITNERLKRIQEGELNEKKFQFFTNISHEFRTPLTLILNPIANLINDNTLNLPSSVKEKHQIIRKNADRLTRLISELLDFRKLEMNRLEVNAKKINLVVFTREIVSYFEGEASDRNIFLSADADVSEFDIWADESMLEKIIFNILSNAFKVTPEGGAITLTISIKNDESDIFKDDPESKSREFVEIRISDTGPGLEPNQLKKIFERFYQVDNLNKAYYGGTGIGLEVVKSFVQLHDGKVRVKSELGKGTTFQVFLPTGKEHFSEKELEEVSKSPFFIKNPKYELNDLTKANENTTRIEKGIKSCTLLIVEDNSELRNYLKVELQDQYKIITATNGKEGLKLVNEYLPDIIITDVIMPEMDGLDFCKTIKSDIRTSHIPVLMLTAKALIDDRIESIEIGADAYMIKPFDMRLVKLRLEQLVKSRKLIFDKYFSAISGVAENENTTSIDKVFIQKILTYINDNISDSDLSVELLASELNLSRSQLYRKVKTLTGQTVNEFLRKIRLQRAKQILEKGSANVSEVCYHVGFGSPSYFTKCFKAHFGILPTEVEIKE